LNVFTAVATRERRHPTALRDAGSARWVATLTVVGVLWVLAAYGALLGWGRVAPADFGADQRFYVEVADRWIETGALYPGQLDGAYQLQLMRDNTYPPNALVLFVPFVVLPAILWWLVPAAIIGYGLWRWRPNAFGWALLALVVLWPRTVGAVLFGNTDLWMAALVTAGLLWGWPAVLLAVKPTLAPLALVGVGHRSWWVMSGVAAALVVATLPLWLDYIAALRNARGLGWDYSIGSLPLVLAPALAWLLRSRSDLGRGEQASGPGRLPA
jgi:hypothetical protein